MADELMRLYGLMTAAAQQELYDFALFLISKTSEYQTAIKSDATEKQKKMDALHEFAGSGKKLWGGMDALAYQNSLREERSIG